ncbi:hypothetical protein ACFY5D_03700 [Paeniglutamicibacter sp. NPDC012692]|uniref:phage tail tube protein n=1 Tax=Paeniglutamicibacter sp. NPDC012692 TaxID=3364388 RepID=UPI0036B66496
MPQKMLTDGNRNLAFVPTLANYHAPKLSELTGAGVLNLSCLITLADFQLGATGNAEINDPGYCATLEVKAPGLPTYEGASTFFRWKDTVDDKGWTTFTHAGIAGYLVERIGQIAEGEKAHEVPFKVGDEVRVFQVLTGTPRVLSPQTASYEKFGMTWYIQEETDERAVVAAGA